MKENFLQKFSILLAFLLMSASSHAQLTINNSLTITQLAQLISGPGVQIMNPQVGGTTGFGKYNATSSNLNITEGLLLTTGTTANAIGPNNVGNKTAYFGALNSPNTYPLLTNYTGRTIYEYREFEFDIIPQGDTLSFDFVFASEEYEEWVGSQFNDVFGFFISGPGIIPDPGAGIYRNIAKLPNSNTPVTINTVNQCVNTMCYQNNNNGTSVQYDGFTTCLKAIACVQPCMTYHLKLIIADASDKLWDSGVFVEKICSNAVTLSSITAGGIANMIEGCNNGSIIFTRQQVSAQSCLVKYWLGGTAINGTDYLPIGNINPALPKYVTIPANLTSVSVPVTTIADALNEGTEYITVYLGNPLCNAVFDSLRFYIQDSLNATLTPSNSSICIGGNVQFTATGGTSFSWSPSASLNNPSIANPIATPTVTTTYTMTTSVANCVKTKYAVVNVSNFSLSFTSSNVTCFGGTNGSATVTATGTGPFTYSWTGPNGFTASTATISNLAAGNYTVVVTGPGNCTQNGTVCIVQPPSSLTVTASSQILACGFNVPCYGATSATATATVSGGTAPYTYSWNTVPVQTGATATNLGAGVYVVTVTDANGCTGSATVTITQPTAVVGAISSQVNVLCYGNTTGSATVTGSGGNAPYTYSWNTSPAQTSATATGLGAGAYVVTVTDVHNCTGTATVTITQPANLSASISAQTNISCNGNNTGSATVSVSGGTAPYTYSWNTSPVQTSATATGLGAGSYVATVTDANGCTGTASVNITQPASNLAASISALTNVSCFGGATGSATVSVSGGTAPYTYSWNTSPVQTSATATGLAAGNYTVTVTDANGCTATAVACIVQPSSGLSASISAQTNVGCTGSMTGSATVSASGGTAPYTYSWNTSPVQTGATASSLGAGSYIATVTDANGCTATASVNITQPPASISASISAQSNISCFGNTNGSATVAVSGGVAPYTYSWNTSPAQTSATASGLGAGAYVVTVTDANGCSASASVTITQPAAALSASISAQANVSCFGNTTGSATVSVSGGTAPYTYSWNTSPVQASATATGLGAGSYNVSVTDANGCHVSASVVITQPAASLSASISAQTNVACFGNTNGSATVAVSGGVAPYTYSWNTSPVQTGAVATNLGAGSYTVSVTDANGCSANATVSITAPASTLTAAICLQTNVTCFGGSDGSAQVMATGGTAPYTYSWNTVPVQATATATGLSAGTYIATVTDANGCTATATATITQPASGLSASISSQVNVFCFGGTNGSATVAVSGGTAPYAYNWNTSPVQATVTASGLGAGSYVVTVTDANGCTAMASVTITQPAAGLSASISAQANVSCFGNTNGSATASVSGGTAPYTYSWNTSPVQTGATASGLAAGGYVVTITDANNCTTSASVVISQPQASLSASISAQTNVSCFSSASGSATVSASGGTAPYTYSWNTSPAQTTATASGLSAGTYVATVTDANGCTATASVTISGPSASLSASISAQTNVSCFAGVNGSATVSVTGGTAPYAYSWNTSPVQTGATASNLAAGSYIVTVTDSNGCTATASVTITQPAASLTAAICAQTNVSCFGGSDGSAMVMASGGTAPYTYSWNTSPVQTTVTATNLSAGTYIVTVTDANGCTASATATITQPPASLSASISAQANASCFGNTNGSATVSVTGGTAPFTYSWNTSPVQTGATATNLAAGSYIVNVTDANGCTASATVVITQPAASLTAAICAQTNVSCFGGSDGSAMVMASGGTAPYTYSWNTSPVQTTVTATNLSAGTYVVTVTDANGCTASATATITQPPVSLSASISAQTNVSCFGGGNGSAMVSVTGGTAPFTYSWNTSPVQTTSTATGLAGGTYVVTVTDANGCTASASVTISEPAASLSASVSAQTNVSCFAGVNGSATVSATGGTAPYAYSWNTLPVQTGATASNLAAGSYTVNVTDANGCTASATVVITQPAASLTAAICAQTNVSCFGGSDGSAMVMASGGTAPYTYSWNTSPVQTTVTATNLSAGTYIVTVTDANGCTASATATITQPPVSLSASISAQTNVSCFGGGNGSATVSVSGGTAPFTYSWNTSPVQTTSTATGLAGGTYVVTVTDANGCTASASVTISEPAASLSASVSAQTNVSCFAGVNGSATVSVTGGTAPYAYSWNTSPVQTGATATNLAAGSYIVNVTDANGCTASATVVITQPAASLTAAICAQTNVSCFGGSDGSAMVMASGGTAPYTYSWNTSPVQTTVTATNLSAGTYVVTVTDANGCTASATATITQPPASLAASISAQTNVSCFSNASGSATVSVSGGTAPYTYSWNTSPVQTGATATGLSAGSYVVTVTDANGCSVSASVNITEPAASLSASVSAQTNVSCFAGVNGSATVSVTGGTAPYAYSWNTSPVQTSATATGLGAGSYVVTVTDSNGCTASASVTITEPAASLSASVSAQSNVSCFAGANGSAAVSVTGGTAPYAYSWSTSPVQTGATASNLTAGTYTVNVTDANGCMASATVSISEPAASLSASISAQTSVSCFGGSTGSADVSVTGGTAPYTYSWNTSPVQTGATASNLSAGTYVVTVTDANGCTASASVTISQPAASLSASISAQTSVSCFGDTTGSATVAASGGTAPYSYSWNTTPSQSSATATGLGAGTYAVVVTDANGCSATVSVTITEPASGLSASISAQTNVSCFGSNNGSATVSVTGGTAPYSYSWNTSPVQTGATASNLAAGNYMVTITDANGCTVSASVSITEPAASLSASISAQTNVSCFGGSTGSADVSVTGGTAPYTYSWNTSPVQTGATASNLSAGTYMVTVTDANGCTATASVAISQPAASLSASISAQTSVTCFGGNTGSADVAVMGGTGPYSYSWNTSPVQTGATASGLAAGTYVVTVTDANGCTASATVTITQPASALAASISASANVSCFGDANGSATVTASGGSGSYSYSWNTSPVQTGATAGGLAAGTYMVTVTDNNGCPSPVTVSVTITEPAAALSVTATASVYNGVNISCFGGNDGAINVSAAGGTAPYTYAWTGPGAFASASQNIANLAAGTYSLTVTDANGCTFQLTQTLIQPAVALSASVAVTNANCSSSSTGSVDLSVNGGTGGYTFMWSGPNSFSASTEDISGLAAGNYMVVITDTNGCTVSASATITQPALIAIAPTVSIYNGGFNISCNGAMDGSISVTVSGGSGTFTYAWSGPSNYTSTNANISGLAAGTYVLVVTDASGCTATATVTLTQPPAITATLTAQVYPGGYNVSCYGALDGSVNLAVSGGVAPFMYAWTGASFSSSSQNIFGLAAGTYYVTVTDANGCTYQDSVTLTQPGPITLAFQNSNYNGMNLSCAGANDGSVDLSVSGGSPAYTYSWSSPGGFTSASEDISFVSGGVYSITVTDANGCSVTATDTLFEPRRVSASAVVTAAACNHADGAIDLTVVGGVEPYVYSWSNGSNQADQAGLSGGSYILIVTDANGCTDSYLANVDQVSTLDADAVITHIQCSGDRGGTISINMLNGFAPYTYTWSNGGSGNNLFGLSAGTYICTIGDSVGCTMIDTFIVVEPPAFLVSVASPTTSAGYNLSGFQTSDGSIDLTCSGGTAPYTFVWSNGATTEDLDGLPAGTYTVTVTDAMGCSAIAMITLSQPLDLAMPTGFSPNSDGQNDFFVVQGLEAFMTNHIEIYNRWGNLVFEADNYNNKWTGVTNEGNELPEATYFVVLTVNEGEITLKNYVDIRR